MTQNSKDAILPAKLKPGDRVCFVSPASPVPKNGIGTKVLQDLGLVVEYGKHVFDVDDTIDYLAGKDEDRLADINDALRNPDIKAIIATRGGKGAYRIADGLDFEAARKHPKLLVGFSEITILHMALLKHGVAGGIHGAPWGENFGKETAAVRTEVVRNNEGVLQQKYVAENKEGQLVELWGEFTAEVREYIDTYDTTIEPGNEVAISPDVVALQRRGCQLIGRAGVGGWINIDYGQDGPRQMESKPWTPTPVNTNMGVHGDWYHTGAVQTYPLNYNPLQRPGDIDLTHTPDFTVMRKVASEEGMTEVFYGTQQEFVWLMGLPSQEDFERMRTVPGLTKASIDRIARSQQMANGTFRTLIVTRGVEPDFSVRRRVFHDWWEFFQAGLI